MKKLAIILSFFILLLATFSSCKKASDQAIVQDKIPSEVLLKITALGFDTTGVQAAKGGYVVEKDIYLSEDNLNFTGESPNLIIANEEQYRTTNTITQLPRIITISQTNLPVGATSTYTAAIDKAIARYNALNMRLQFQRVAANGMINITDGSTVGSGNPGYTGTNVWGQSGFPSGGNAFFRIGLNVPFFNSFAGGPNVDQNFLASEIAHEMGHCIGMRHTDYFNRAYSGCGVDSQHPANEGAGSDGAINIPGTPTGGDPNSWMLACAGYGDNRPFNANDVTALQYLYGNGTHAYTVTATSCNGSGSGTYTVTGPLVGDIITMRIQMGGYIVWNGAGNGAGVYTNFSGPGTSKIVSTQHYMSNGNTFSVVNDITFTMTSTTITLYSTILKYNATAGSSVSGTVSVTGSNGGNLYSSNSVNACVGASSGNW